MKSFLIIAISLSMLCLSANDKQDVCCKKQDKEKYSKAWDYIQRDSINTDKTIYIFDSIADLDKWPFREDINNILGENKTIEDYYKFEWKENEYSPVLAFLFPDNKSYISDKILVFSDIDDNMIIANLWNRKHYPESWDFVQRAITRQIDTRTTIGWARRFTQGYIYLFIFDGDGSIKHISKHYVETD